jgi:hypothetical protein
MLSRFRGLCLIYGRVLDWIDWHLIHSTRNHTLSLVCTLHSSLLRTHYGSQSSLVASWQRFITVSQSLQATAQCLPCHYSRSISTADALSSLLQPATPELGSQSGPILESSELLCDGRFLTNQLILASSHLRFTTNYFFFNLNTCCPGPYVRVTFSLTKGCVCRLQLLLVLASAVIFGSESRGIVTIFYCLSFERLPQPERPDSCIYIPKEQGGPVTQPQALDSFFVPS